MNNLPLFFCYLPKLNLANRLPVFERYSELSDLTLQLIQLANQGKTLMSNTKKATSTKPTNSHLSSLQLTEQHKAQSQDPIIQRRNKLIEPKIEMVDVAIFPI